MTSKQYHYLKQKANRRIAVLRKHPEYTSSALQSVDRILKNYGTSTFETVPINKRQSQIEDIEYFLGLKTSTLSGIKSSKEKRDTTFRDLGYNADLNTLYEYLSSDDFARATGIYSSDQILETLIELQDSPEMQHELLQQLGKFTTKKVTRKQYLERKRNASSTGFNI